MQEQAKKLKFEAEEYFGTDKYGAKTKCKTWAVAQATYAKKLNKIEYKIAIATITDDIIILIPKGARGAFDEPFSHYTDNGKFDFRKKRLWDGSSKETIGGEFEWIGQRGSRLRVISVTGNTIYFQLVGLLH